MEIKCKGKALSLKAEERFRAALAAIEQANPQIDWGKFKAYVIVRKFYRWRIPIFPVKRVFLDIVDKSERTEIKVPAEVFGMEYTKKGLGGRPMWSIRFRDVKAVKRFRKITIKMEGE